MFSINKTNHTQEELIDLGINAGIPSKDVMLLIQCFENLVSAKEILEGL